jgi:hypothetical protein
MVEVSFRLEGLLEQLEEVIGEVVLSERCQRLCARRTAGVG